MRPVAYPFSAIVGQPEMKLALLLAAVDWRLGVLLRGDKGSGKTTTARGLAALLPAPAPFVNLPIGTTEDRLLGGLHLERTLKGDPVLKPGLLAEAHGGVLYVDEINLLPAHLGDALLDAASSGVHVVEREGMSAVHPAEFVLLGSMNPEEGSLRPQLLDRFALSVMVHAPLDPTERQEVMQRRISFERDPLQFASEWSDAEAALQSQIIAARIALPAVRCSSELMGHISSTVCALGIRSMRADLAAARAAVACAAIHGDQCVTLQHIESVMPLVLDHRTSERRRSTPPSNHPAPPTQSSTAGSQPEAGRQASAKPTEERIFAPADSQAPFVETLLNGVIPGTRGHQSSSAVGAVIGSRQSGIPAELDLRATLSHAVRETGGLKPRLEDLHTQVRKPRTGTRFLFVVDSSGSHAAQQRMRLVKGAISSLLTRSFKRDDEVAIIVFRGTSAQVILEPTQVLPDAVAALEYLPTGGRTPLAAALRQAEGYLTPSTLLVLLTDGRANIAMDGGDPWQEALAVAREMRCSAVVVDTEIGEQRLEQCAELAETLGARYVSLEGLGEMEHLSIHADRERQGV
jgi:magnesium chelatase subunit D